MHTRHVIGARCLSASAAALATVLTSCGARSSISGDGGAATGQTSASSSASTTGAGGPCTVDGIRLCKNPECTIPAGACPGLGCTPAADRETGMPEEAGVCWADVPNFLTESCTACKDGEVCVHRSPTELFCVPFDVCDRLYKLGATTACRYADKTPFTDAPLESGASCPLGMTNLLCGGACGACKITYPWACVGRSATRPFGVCVSAFSVNQPPFLCSYDATGKPIQPCTLGWCAVFDNPAPDNVISQRFGVCMPGNDCVSASKGTPLKCLDAVGVNHGS
jgi:hypothetical protein